jgi:hypothetical protein
MTRRSCLLLAGFAALPLAIAGCGEEYVGIPHTHHPEAEITLCGICGEVKEGEKCCKEGAPICPNCGMQKGSILCCSPAISGRKDVILCRKCGEAAFTKKCCSAGPALCPKCGLHKGSPGCCKIEKFTGDAADSAYEHAHEGNHG